MEVNGGRKPEFRSQKQSDKYFLHAKSGSQAVAFNFRNKK